jgi:hypothetical protein
MRKRTLTTPSSGFKGLQPLVAANFSHSSLQGSVKSVTNINSAKRCRIPEAISLHHATDESISTVAKTLHYKLRAERLPRRLSSANKTNYFVSIELNSETLLAMTKGSDFGVQGSESKSLG